MEREALLKYFLEKEFKEVSKIFSSRIEEDSQKFLDQNQDLLKNGLKCYGLCFPKFKFGSSYISDFIIMDFGSMGVDINLIEIEPPTSKIFNKDGSYSKRLNSALTQINNWKVWIHNNRDYFTKQIYNLAGEEDYLEYRSKEIGYKDYLNYRSKERFGIRKIRSTIIIGRNEYLRPIDNERRSEIYRQSNGELEIVHFDRFLHIYIESELIKKIRRNELSLEDQRLIASSNMENLIFQLLDSKNYSDGILQLLAISTNEIILKKIAGLDKLPKELLYKLSKCANDNIVRIIARREDLPNDIIEQLSSNTYFLKELIKSNSCSMEILKKAIDNGGRLRIDAVLHSNFNDVYKLKEFSKSDSWVLRKSVAINPNTPKEILEGLKNDDFDGVSYIARERLK